MSTFKMPRKTALLVFDGEYEGAEVRVRLSVGLRTGLSFALLTATNAAEMIEQIERFCREVLVDWNLVDDEGQSIPATAEALLDQPQAFVMALINNWKEAAMNVASPLDAPSLNGSTLEEEFAAMGAS